MLIIDRRLHDAVYDSRLATQSKVAFMITNYISEKLRLLIGYSLYTVYSKTRKQTMALLKTTH